MPASNNARFDTIHGDSVDNLFLLSSLGHIPGVEVIDIQGDCDAISTTPFSVMWHPNGIIQNTGIFQASPVTIYASSDNAADVGNILRVIIMDGNYDRQVVGVVLNGQAGVALPIQGIRVLYAEVVQGDIAGDVWFGTEANPVGGTPAVINTLNNIHVTHHNTHGAFGTVPRGYTMFLRDFYGGSAKNDELTFYGLYRPWVDATTQYGNFIMSISIPAYRAMNNVRLPMRRFNEKTDFYIGAVSGAGGASGTVYSSGILVKNEYIGEYV